MTYGLLNSSITAEDKIRSERVSHSRSIPSLDGLRALAVLMVILGHCESKFLDSLSWISPFRNGSIGVSIFFAISGLLITGLLLKELDVTRGIDLRRFYIRRSFRIFPAFYLYLLIVGCLSLLHLDHSNPKSFLAAATYTWNYYPFGQGWLLGHTWSLSVEEQFYLLWPACLYFFSPRACLRIAWIVIFLSPLSRVLSYALFPLMRGHIPLMLHTRLDAIMVGSFVALARNQGAFKKLLVFAGKRGVLATVVLYLLLQPYLTQRFRGTFALPVGDSLDAVSCMILVLFATENPASKFGRLLNHTWMRHVGVISYGLYLWQQLFDGPHTFLFPLNVVVIFMCAELSYWLVEKPLLRLRDRIFVSSERV